MSGDAPGILLIGGGGHCHAVIDVIEDGGCSLRYAVVGIIDAERPVGETVFGYPILGSDGDLQALLKSFTRYALITVGQVRTPEPRLRIARHLAELRAECPSLVSSSARFSPRASLGAGSVVMHHAFVNSGASIGEHCIINSCALVEHDVKVGDFTHIATGAVVNGSCQIGSRCFLGSNSVLVHGVSIVSDTVIGAGAVVTHNIDVPGTYVGNPTHLLRESKPLG